MVRDDDFVTGVSPNKPIMVQNNTMPGHLIIYYPTNLRVSEQVSEQMSAAERASEATSAPPQH